MSDNNETQITELTDALEALKNARKDAATQRTQKANALNRVEALSSALRAAGLDPDSDDLDTRAASLKDASKALETTDALNERLSALTELLTIYQDKTGINLSDVVASLPQNATDAQVDALIDSAFQPLQQLKADAYEGLLAQAASYTGKDADALREVLDGKTIEQRTETIDGKEVKIFGVTSGDTFKPLTELRSVQLLGNPVSNAAASGTKWPAGQAQEQKPQSSSPFQAVKAQREQVAPVSPFTFVTPGGTK